MPPKIARATYRVNAQMQRELRKRNSLRFLAKCGSGKMATLMGLEPTTSAVTGRRSNQLSYSAKDRHRYLAFVPTATCAGDRQNGGHGWD
jgi:hypothetical protein